MWLQMWSQMWLQMWLQRGAGGWLTGLVVGGGRVVGAGWGGVCGVVWCGVVLCVGVWCDGVGWGVVRCGGQDRGVRLRVECGVKGNGAAAAPRAVVLEELQQSARRPM